MATNYPSGLDSFTAPNPGDALGSSTTGRKHSERHRDIEDAVEAIETELGVDPSGASASVVARLDALDSAWPAADAAHEAAGDPHPQYATDSDLAGKASTVHTHAEADVTNLVADLANLDTRLSNQESATPNVRYVTSDGSDANDGRTWATAKATVAAAVTALSGQAGVVDIGSGTFSVATTITVPKDVMLRGQGVHATVLQRTANVPVIDLSGQHPGTTTTVKNTGQALRDLTLDGGSNAAWTSSLLVAWYVAEAMFDHVNFVNSFGAGVDGIEFWDSYFVGCRWTDCAGAAGSGLASVYMRASTGAGSGLGHSTDNVNNLWFVNCVMESFQDGAVNAVGAPSQKHNKINFVNCKLETRKAGGPVVKVDNVEGWNFQNVNVLLGEFRAGYSTPINVFELQECYGCNWTNIRVETIDLGYTSIANVFYSLGWTSACTFYNINGVVQTTNKPTGALINWNTGQTGSNPPNAVTNVFYSYNPGSAALFAGTPKALAQPYGMEQVIVQTSGYTLTSQTGAQKAFNSTTNGALSVKAGNTYQFEGRISLTSMSSSSGSFGFAIGGTATLSSITWHSLGSKAATLATATAVQGTFNSTNANTACVTATTDTSGWLEVRGEFRVSADGTVIPQVSLGVAAAAVVGTGSFLRVWTTGTSSVQSVGNWT